MVTTEHTGIGWDGRQLVDGPSSPLQINLCGMICTAGKDPHRAWGDWIPLITDPELDLLLLLLLCHFAKFGIQ